MLATIGVHNSIQTQAIEKTPALYMMNCPYHILHNTAQKAGDAFRNVCVTVHTVMKVGGDLVG